MSRPRSGEGIGCLGLLAIILVLFQTVEYWLPIAVVGGLVVVVSWLVFARLHQEQREAAISEMRATVDRLITQHLETLIRKRAQTLFVDDYGNMLTDRWLREIDYFMETVVFPALTPKQRTALEAEATKIRALIYRRVAKAEAASPWSNECPEGMDPLEFERFCAGILEAQGWRTRVTKASGDQGVDVIAEKDGKRLVVQCKLYDRPVGNSAVQAIAAGKMYEQAEFAAVATNSTFTKSARSLAATTNVHLLHYQDLRRINAILAVNGPPKMKGS